MENQAPKPAWQLKYTFISLVILNVISRLLVAIRPLEYIDGLCIPDDAYLSLTIARNIARGIGPHYGFDYTNGFQPLYVFLMAPTYLIFPNIPIIPIRIALIFSIVLDTITLFLLLNLIRKHCVSQATILIMGIAWIFNPYIISTTLNGMETSLSFFFIVLSYYKYYQYLNFEYRPRDMFFWGLLLGLACLARIDNCFLVFIIVLLLVLQIYKRERGFIHTPKFIMYLLIGLGVTLFPWLIYSFIYTGDFYPISGKAVRFMSLHWLRNVSPGQIILTMLDNAKQLIINAHQFFLIVIIGLLGIFPLIQKRGDSFERLKKNIRRYNPILVFSFLIFLSYTFYIFAPWYFNRYLFPITLLLLVYITVLVDIYDSTINGKAARLLFRCSIICLLLVGNITNIEFRSLYFSTDTTSRGYMNLGMWARTHFKNGTIIGSTQTGALGYFADNLSVINLDGVVNKQCYESLVQKRNIEYIKNSNIEFVIGWPGNIDLIGDQSANIKNDDLILVGKILGFASWGSEWYLVKVNYNN
jgi:hypothetical protein